MSKSARFVNKIAIDVIDTTVLPDWADTPDAFIVKMYPETHGDFQTVSQDCVAGWYLDESGTPQPPVLYAPAIELVPSVLPNLEFLRYAAAQLGSGGRVTEIIEGFRDHATADLRYGFQEFDKATSFDKARVGELLIAGVTGGILTAEEQQLINENWPEA
jgi:hypothetical protein|tara:strand:- start:3711 stop:4190 length:480 start_codon:yes stop_codon:yes gene_type:complete